MQDRFKVGSFIVEMVRYADLLAGTGNVKGISSLSYAYQDQA